MPDRTEPGALPAPPQPRTARRRRLRRQARLWQLPAAAAAVGSLALGWHCFSRLGGGDAPDLAAAASDAAGAGALSGPRRELLQAAGTPTVPPTGSPARNTGVTFPVVTAAPTEEALYPDDAFSKEQLKDGAVLLHVIGIFYMFWGLAIICDDFFVPALEVITERLALSEDVAGATFMAAGGSAPELFTSIFGVFVAKSNVGFGTIVGSAVFNVLFVIGACAAFTRPLAAAAARKVLAETGEVIPWYHQGLELTSYPLARDSVFYGVDLIVVLFMFRDSKIYWYEALIVLLLYSLYVVFMKFNEFFFDLWQKATGRVQEGAPEGGGQDGADKSAEIERRHSECPANINREARNIRRESRRASRSAEMEMAAQQAANKTAEEDKKEDEDDDDDDGPWEPTKFPEDAVDKVKFVLAFPLNFVLWLTVPNCTNEEKKKWYVLSFVLSIVWIAFFSYFMVWWADTLGQTADIPPEVMGLTLLAAGTSVPDLITSVVVARAGHGDMAVSSSIGSNIFDIAFGLPLPWFLYALTVNKGEDPIDVTSNSLGSSVIMLFCMLLATIACIAIFRWKLNAALGLTSLFLYIVFLTFTLLIEYEEINGIDL
eukprot:TRINITY_DN2352_c0_g1_i1.p1 TRINITY_DN2352_c0_g1~~TRINITY_DN2352_c0_g1_i1.p1  ORF type:complete len:629 (+),score=210.95 TRINITY_DN2352_c0_g1_i1:89-1888(+)